jgi:hypothetical protein
MRSASLSKRSIAPAPEPPQVDAVGQLRMALLVLRDELFALQEASTTLSDVITALYKLVLRIEATMVPTDTEAGHGR